MSHGNIVNLRESLLGETLNSPDDVRRLHFKARRRAMDIQQVDHAQSAVDIALWDVLGKKLRQPVYALLGYGRAYPKLPYCSVLFGEDAASTQRKAEGIRKSGYRAGKFGWGLMGQDARTDIALVRAARQGLGPDARLMVDAGVAWGRDVETAYQRACQFAPFNITWLEEPLLAQAVEEYGRLKEMHPLVAIAGGEGCSTYRAAEDFIRHGKPDYVQIDVGRIGGITVADQVCRLAQREGVIYVNHTFKSHLHLAASLHVFAGVEEFLLTEYPETPSPLARELTTHRILPDTEGYVRAPDGPGLGIEVSLEALHKYLKPVRVEVAGKVVFDSELL